MAAAKQLMLIAVDDSPHSMYALEWTLDHFFAPFGANQPFRLVAIHARPVPVSFIQLAGPGNYAEITLLSYVHIVLFKPDSKPDRHTMPLEQHVNEVNVEVMEGDPRNVLCEAVDKHHASVLVVGSHGYGLMKRAVLGSVSDYCAHHAHCSVMIVKKPKT
ncbi:hypothetical protein V6N13_060844 [Hibiscus sabdariffa]|uniref:UspA domain-containing protein n=1 Tax=Hibiscus sabdariffa TaxID=183260 RepID=A0ABR2P6I1_9ROSI